MEFGAVIPHHEIGADAGAVRAFAEGAEELGCTHLMIYDHVVGVDPNRPGGFQGPYDKDVGFREPMTLLAYVAAVTRRAHLVTSVLISPQRQTVLLAKQAAELAMLSDGRFRLGIGTGWNTFEYLALGVPFERRGKRQEEQVDLMRRLWTEDAFSYDGEFHTLDHSSIFPRPSQPVPILFGGSAPALLERCGRLGDGWIPLGTPNDASRERMAAIRTAREAAGKSMDGFLVHAQAQYGGGTPERWQSHAEKWRELGATHLAVATHNAGDTDVDGHLARVAQYLAAVR